MGLGLERVRGTGSGPGPAGRRGVTVTVPVKRQPKYFGRLFTQPASKIQKSEMRPGPPKYNFAATVGWAVL